MTKFMNENKEVQQQDELKALDIIKKNLKKEKFKSHKQVEEFLASKKIYISQASISRLFNNNMIKKMMMVTMKILLKEIKN